MNINILKIAANTKNNKKIKNFTHKSKHKNLFSPNAIIESVEQGLKLEFYTAINNERNCINYWCKWKFS